MRTVSTVQQYALRFLNIGQYNSVPCAFLNFTDGIWMRTVSTVQQYASYFLNRGIQMHTVSTVQQCASCFPYGGI